MMRKFLYLAFVFFIGSVASGQLKFQGTLVNGPSGTTVDVIVRPVGQAFNGYFTNIVLVIQIPNTAVQPSITPTSLSSYFATFSPLASFDDGTYINYAFSASNTTITTNTAVALGHPYPLVRFEFTGGNASLSTMRLAHLDDGGPGTLYQFYVEANDAGAGANDFTRYVQMFYGEVVSPASELPDEATGYSTYQFAQFGQLLPVSWLGFTAQKQNRDALLKWTVTAETNNHHYELERSQNGTHFVKVAEISNLPGTGTKNYSYVDQGIARYSSTILYYRIKQVDLNGNSSYSPVRSLRLDMNGQIAIHPNPVKKGFYLSIPFSNPSNKKVSLNLLNAAGQVVDKREITASQASNYYYDIQINGVISGNYMLRIYSDNQLLDTKKLVIER